MSQENRYDALYNGLGEITERGERMLSFKHISELMSKELPEAKWVIEQLIPADGMVVISAMPASFKTWFILGLAISVASGTPFLDKFKTEKTSVLLIDEESGERLLKQRLKQLTVDSGLSLYYNSFDGFRLEEGLVNQLIEKLKESHIGLVIIDSLVRVHDAAENDATEMSKVLGLFRRFNNEGIAVIFTHHNRKNSNAYRSVSSDMRGSSDILAVVDSHLSFRRDDNDKGLVAVNQTKMRYGAEMKPFLFRLMEDEETKHVNLIYDGEMNPMFQKKDNCMAEIIKLLSGEAESLLKTEIRKQVIENSKLSIGSTVFKSCLDELIKDGTIIVRKANKNESYCSLAKIASESHDDETKI